MSFVRTLYHPLNHIWLRAKEPLRKNTACSTYRILELGITERGLEDIGDITSLQQSADFFKRSCGKINQNDGVSVQRGDELLQIHFDGHSISSADELYHTVWETFSDHLSILSPISGRIIETESDMDATLKSLEQEGIDEQTILMGIKTTEEEWEDICRQNYFVNGSEYFETIEKQQRGAFY
jgi:hypothetical protein